jgi:hypothetical protein
MKNFKRTSITILLILIFSIALIFSACDDTVTNAEVDKRIIPSSNVDYYEHIQPVFNIKCATALCHDDGTRASNLSLTTYSNALVWSIEGTGGSFMPPQGAAPPLTDNQIQGIRTWIDEGAKPHAD